MQALHGDGIIQWAASAVTAPSAMVMYEQTPLSCGGFRAVFVLGGPLNICVFYTPMADC